MRFILKDQARAQLLWAAGALLAVFVLGANDWRGPFLYDDIDQIVKNGFLHDLSRLRDIVFCGYRQIRLAQNVSFAWDWWVGGGSTWSFHLTNVVLHLVNSVLAYAYLRRVASRYSGVPEAAAALFALHPLQTEAYSYVMGRVSLLCFFFFIVSLNLAARARGKFSWALVATQLLAISAKETCVLIAPLILVHQLTIDRLKLAQIHWKGMAWYFGAACLYLPFAYVLRDPGGMYRGNTGFAFFPFWQYLAAQMYFLCLHLGLLVYPPWQSLLHEYPIFDARVALLSACGFALYGGGLAWAVRNARKSPLPSFMIFFYVISNGPTNTIIQFVNPFAEYRLYQSNLALFVLACCAASAVLARFRVSVPRLVTFAVLAYFSGFTFLQQRNWDGGIPLLEHSLENYPRSYRLEQMMGGLYESRGRLEEAESHFKRAIELASTDPLPSMKPRVLLAQLYLITGRNSEALRILDDLPLGSLRFNGIPLNFYEMRLKALAGLGRRQEFEETRERALRAFPDAAAKLPVQ